MTLITNNEEETSGFWICYTCGIDIPYKEAYYRKPKYDEFYNDTDEKQVSDELDEYFYQKYPQFRNT